MNYYSENLELIKKWSKMDTEDSNFYYQLTPLNQLYLSHTISKVTGETPAKITEYFDELLNDQTLRTHLENSRELLKTKNTTIDYGRRLGWYAIVRVAKPQLVVETGVEHGVGACVITAALIKNSEEGFAGRYLGTDIRTSAGEVFTAPYSNFGEVLYGDSIESLKRIDQKIDVFINDSDHSSDYEFQEYLTVQNKLTENSIILGDNSHVTDCLARFSINEGRNFLFFAEKPRNHWYPGAGIGISFKSQN
jgi:predicted O-methyltransferase YrrM